MGSLWETERLAEQGGEDDSVRKIKQNPDRQIKRVIIFSHFLRNSHGHGVKLLPKIFLIHFFSQRRNPPRIQTITRRLFWTDLGNDTLHITPTLFKSDGKSSRVSACTGNNCWEKTQTSLITVASLTRLKGYLQPNSHVHLLVIVGDDTAFVTGAHVTVYVRDLFVLVKVCVVHGGGDRSPRKIFVVVAARWRSRVMRLLNVCRGIPGRFGEVGKRTGSEKLRSRQRYQTLETYVGKADKKHLLAPTALCPKGETFPFKTQVFFKTFTLKVGKKVWEI